jgi:lipopolysaccharide export system protein LptA
MQKKLFLAGSGLVVAVGAFLAYQYFTGADWSFHAPVGVGPATAPEVGEGFTTPKYETRTPEGVLQSLFTADRSTQIDAGAYRVERPRIMYFFKNNQTLMLTSDTGVIRINQLGSFVNAKNNWKIEGATLSGHVLLTLGPKDSFDPDSTTIQTGQIQAKLEQDMDFDYGARTLTSDGAIEVRGEKIWFNGRNLTVSLNLDQQRIEYLRIEQGNKLILRNARSAGPKPAGATTTAPTTIIPPAPPPPPPPPVTALAAQPQSSETPTTSPAATHPARVPTIYRLVFGRDVLAAVGDFSLAAQQMTLFSQTSPNSMDDSPRPAATAPASAEPGAFVPPTNPLPASTQRAPVDLATPDHITPQDLVVTWTGPMEMRPDATVPLSSPKAALIQATGTAAEPVILRNGATQKATAATFSYDTGIQTALLQAGDQQPVELTDATKGKLTCSSLTFNQVEGTMLLMGPGQLLADAKTGSHQSARWQRELQLFLTGKGNLADPTAGHKDQTIRRAIFMGDAQVADANSRVSADQLDVQLIPGPKKDSVIDHVDAAGHVQVVSNRQQGGHDQSDTLNTDHLVLTTVADATAGRRPDTMLATGNVDATIHSSGAADKASTQRIITPQLTVTLAPKTQATANAPAGALGDVAVSKVAADGGVSITMISGTNAPVTATSNTLRADAITGVATLEGSPPASFIAATAPASQPVTPPADAQNLAVLTQGSNLLRSAIIHLTQKDESVTIPGGGALSFIPPAKKGDTPSPVKITWADSMSYDGKQKTATFKGPVHATMLGKSDQHSTLDCDNLQVTVADNTPPHSTTPAVKPAATSPGALPGEDRMKLSEIIARGNVIAQGDTLDANGAVINRLYLTGDTLVYDDPSHLMTVPGPGRMLVEDLRPDVTPTTPAPTADAANPLGAGSARGSTAFQWSQSLSFDSAQNVIALHKDVVMVHKPNKPIAAGKTGSANAAIGKGDGLMILKTQDLLTTLTQAKGTTNNPMQLGTGGTTKLSHVTADGGSILSLNDSQLSAKTLQYDADKGLAAASGDADNPAVATRPDGVTDADRIEWNVTQGNAGFTFYGVRGLMH